MFFAASVAYGCVAKFMLARTIRGNVNTGPGGRFLDGRVMYQATAATLTPAATGPIHADQLFELDSTPDVTEIRLLNDGITTVPVSSSDSFSETDPRQGQKAHPQCLLCF